MIQDPVSFVGPKLLQKLVLLEIQSCHALGKKLNLESQKVVLAGSVKLSYII